MTIEQRVKQFIVENFYVPDPRELNDDTSLIDGGYIDSTGMLELIAFVETGFGLRVSDAEMTPENLGSIARIATFVARRQAELAS